MTNKSSKASTIVFRLALADLRHEWILSLCLMLAIAAVIAPLLLLMGLKHGTITTLRHELIQDPLFREIRPVKTREYASDWFARQAGMEQVEFLIPTILAASSIISVVRPGSRRSLIYDLVPTRAGDPLLLENGGVSPAEGECVLTDAGAKTLGVKAGDHIKVRATRIRGGRRESGAADLQVVAVLNPRASALNRLYAPLEFVLDVESYKEGLAIPARGWPGGTPRPPPSFDGMLVLLPEALRPVQETGLVINTGLTGIERADAALFLQRTGLRLPEGFTLYDLKTSQTAVQLSSYRAVRDKLRGKGALVLPYVRDLRLELPTGSSIGLAGLSLSADQMKRLGLAPLPWGALRESPPAASLFRILAGAQRQDGELLAEYREGAAGTLKFPLRVSGTTFGELALVPAELAGILRTARQRKVTYSEEHGDFLLQRGGFRGFRMYTRRIDDVPPMVDRLKSSGVDVIARIEAIERVRVLDRGLSRIFWLVAVVGISGGIAALIASLYAAVERKQHELSVLRLIGLSRNQVFMFPVYQGAVLAMLSLLLAITAYFSLAAVINFVFSADLDLGEKICQLPWHYLSASVVATATVAVLSSLLAAWHTTSIDPGEALRYE